MWRSWIKGATHIMGLSEYVGHLKDTIWRSDRGQRKFSCDAWINSGCPQLPSSYPLSPLRLFCSSAPSPGTGHVRPCVCSATVSPCLMGVGIKIPWLFFFFFMSLKNLFLLPGHSSQNQSLSRTGMRLMSNPWIPAITGERNTQHEHFVTPTTVALVLYWTLDMASCMLTSMCTYTWDRGSSLKAC